VASSHTMENRGSPWKTEAFRATAGRATNLERLASQSRRTQVAQVAGEHPRAFWWVPKNPVDSGESDEHPKTLGGGSRARWGTEVLRCTVCRAVEP